jgi:hypothetical protein
MRQSLTTNLNDADAESSAALRVRVAANDSAISIFPEGYGDFGSAPGHGCPVFLELYHGRLRLVVFPDINDQEPTIIDLESAREDQHVPCEEGTPERLPQQQSQTTS